MESQLVAGQWVEVSVGDLHAPVLLSGFVLSMQPSEVLLTFPDLLAPPKGLEFEAQATLRYGNRSSQHTAIGRILRVASGPPVTVTFKRLAPTQSDSKRPPSRTAASLPVAVRVVTSSVSSSLGQEDMPGLTENVSANGILLATSLLLAVGDVVRLLVTNGAEAAVVHGRVIRVCEGENKVRGQFVMGVELTHEDHVEREGWLAFLAHFQRRERR
jgi:hypothetical protein